jgi:glycosyltransferase involved in cell wall biosynthesis
MSALVSIIVPCYNSEAWVAAALESALRQTWSDKEVIVVNDGSKDGSLAVARRFEDRGVRVLNQPNAGASAARNAGLRAARGQYIQFLDADDLLALDKLEHQMRLLQPLGVGVLSSSRWAHFCESPEEADFKEQANYRDLTGVEFLQLHWEESCMMQPAAWLAPRALLEAAGPWDESLSLNDDGEYFARVMLAAERIVFCREARTYYRAHHGARLSARRDRRSLESLYQSVKLTTERLLAADASTRTRGAVAYAWKWTAFELYPDAPELSRLAEAEAGRWGGSPRPFPAGPRFQMATKLIGWRLARRWFA